ncbi:hypothetical protein RJ639_008373 [Escallonia herrerae]|uniref:Uncharacterized protein n=1 Tax=Escallonia herrerae TaxID=1293975 RepID=A0AA89ARX4_9ASTE|nr:hypothetical protein RJ639_008373 [Escallonia herrerae]
MEIPEYEELINEDDEPEEPGATPLWKYVTKISVESSAKGGGGSNKFVCNFDCRSEPYSGSYTRVRYHLIGTIPGTVRLKKKTGINMCSKITRSERDALVQEEVAANQLFGGNSKARKLPAEITNIEQSEAFLEAVEAYENDDDDDEGHDDDIATTNPMTPSRSSTLSSTVVTPTSTTLTPQVNGKAIRAMVDTGATHNYISSTEVERLGLTLEKGCGRVKAINSAAQPVAGIARSVLIKIGPYEGRTNFSVVIMDDFKLILGLEFLRDTDHSDAMYQLASHAWE